MRVWKTTDKDGDGSISETEFALIPRIQSLPEEKRMRLFKRLDKDANGKLDRAEIGRFGKRRDGQEPPMPRLWELDKDHSGGVSFEEFQAGGISKKLAPEKQMAVFRKLDTNSDGVISPEDKPTPPFRREGGNQRQKRANDSKPENPRMEFRQMIRQLDQDGDGALSFDEFRASPTLQGLSEDVQEDRFEALDKNHDLKINSKDFPSPAPQDEPKRPQAPPAD